MSSNTENVLSDPKECREATSIWQSDCRLDTKLEDMDVEVPVSHNITFVSTLQNASDSVDSSEVQTLQTLENVQPRIIEYATDCPIDRGEDEANTMTIDSLDGVGVVRIEERSLDNANLAYPIANTDISTDEKLSDDLSENTMLSTSINSAIVQNFTKLPQSHYMLNVDSGVANVATIQTVSQGVVGSTGQTLWLPTILTSTSENKNIDIDKSPTGVSQIILASGAENYLSQTLSTHPSARRSNIITETNYLTRPKTSKVHILGNITIPKSSTMGSYNQHFISQTLNEPEANTCGQPNHIYKVNTNLPSHLGKQLNHSLPNHKTSTLISTGMNTTQMKPLTNTQSKLGSYKPSNKMVNNKSASNISLSHSLNATKGTVNSARKGYSGKGIKNICSQNSVKNSTPRYVKITQQTNMAHKNDVKNWTLTNLNNSKYSHTYAYPETGMKTSLPRRTSPSRNLMPLANNPKAKTEQRFLLQANNTQVIVTNPSVNAVFHRGPNYVQSNLGPTVRYVTADSQMTNLTAQFLHKLAQPKLQQQNYTSVIYSPTDIPMEHDYRDEARRHIYGDPATLIMADDIVGTEERPNLSNEIRRYSNESLALVLLDHTYAQTSQVVSPQITSPELISPNPIPMAISPSLCPSPPVVTALPQPDDDAVSATSSLSERRDRAGSDTETAPEGEEEGRTRCICDFGHDDGYMICCDRCGEWQHVDCMGVDRLNIPEAYMCERCEPRPVDRRRARAIQMRKREELSALAGSESDSSGPRLLTVTTYSDTSGRPAPTAVPTKRGPRRQLKKPDQKKGLKRKANEKRMKRKKDLVLNRNKHDTSDQPIPWLDSYECAVTNHYSPELRAKIVKYSSKCTDSPDMASAITAHYCTTVPHAGGKILIATKDLRENMPVIEIRGKYMLSTQHRPQLQVGSRISAQKPGPFVFFYKLPRDNTQICIDTRTYGNEGRFVRRSCKPNAELQHCIVKGTLHVYLVTISPIQSNTEITVGYDLNSPKQPCACGNPKYCKMNGISGPLKKKLNRVDKHKEKKKKRISSSPASPPVGRAGMIRAQTKFNIIKEKRAQIKAANARANLRNTMKQMLPAPQINKDVKTEVLSAELQDELNAANEFLQREPIEEKKEIIHVDIKPTNLEVVEDVKPIEEEVKDVKIEEEKPEPIKEATVPPPMIEQVKEEYQSDDDRPLVEELKKEEKSLEIKNEEVKQNEEVKPTKEVCDEREKSEEKSPSKESPKKCKDESLEEKPKSRCERTTRSTRASQNTSTPPDSDEKTDDSQDKITQPTSTEKDKRKLTREERKMEAIMKAFERMEKAAARKQEVRERQSKRRESDPAPAQTNDKKEPEVEEESKDPQAIAKKRKRRKGRARTVSTRRRSSGGSSGGAVDEAASLRSLGLSQARLLVEAAVGPLEAAFKPPPAPPAAPVPQQHSAKKRWLRQAISEESDSPTAESPPSEMVTPLKKRRLARESLCEQTNALITRFGGTSPVITSEDSPVKEDSRDSITSQCIMKPRFSNALFRSDDYSPNIVSSIVEDDHSNDCETKLEGMSVDLTTRRSSNFELDIRRIIGVPGTEESSDEPETVCPTPIDENENEFQKQYKVEIERMDVEMSEPQVEAIDLTESSPKKVEPPKVDDVVTPETPVQPLDIPVPDEMEDIQKKIHSFHTENIQILKIRNKKEKRKKVALNFELNMIDDQISVELCTDDIPLPPGPPVECIPYPLAPKLKDIPLPLVPEPLDIPLPPDSPNAAPHYSRDSSCSPVPQKRSPRSVSPVISIHDSPRPSSPRVSPRSTSPKSSPTGDTPSVLDHAAIESMLKPAESPIMTAPLEVTFERLDEDSDATKTIQGDAEHSPSKDWRPFNANDPRLQPSPQPKPVKRKLSLTEYRKRLRMSDGGREGTRESNLDCEQDVSYAALATRGVFDAEPTQVERQRENLSQRLRREFGLSLPDEDPNLPPITSPSEVIETLSAGFLRTGPPR